MPLSRAIVASNMATPTVSVVVGAYQAAAYLQRSLASVLEQSFDDFELVVVDDGSTDATPAILAALAAQDTRVRVLRQENQGLTAALRRGCDEARGELIARHDADDLSLPERFARQVECLRRDIDAAFVTCWSQALGPRDEPLYEVRTGAGALEALLGDHAGPAGHGSVMFRAHAYRQAGGYRPEFRYAQDWDLWLRLAECGPLACASDVLYSFRVNEHSISAKRRSQQLRLAALARRCANARRTGQAEQPWVEQAALVSAEPAPGRGRQNPGNSYFIGKCLLVRRDARCREYLRRAVRERPWHWRAWAALAWAHALRRGAASQAPDIRA
jgi:glycosyltransferase involved in cell wall biosynthesis